MGEDRTEAGEIGAGGLHVLGRVGIGTIDQHQFGQRGQVALDKVDGLGFDTEHLGREVGTADEHRLGGGWAGAAGGHDIGSDQGVDQGTFAGARAAPAWRRPRATRVGRGWL